MKDFKKVTNELKNVKVNNVVITRIRNVNVTDMTTWQRVALTLDNPVKGYVADEDGNYKEGETNIIFVSAFSLIAAVRETEYACIGDFLRENPNIFKAILSRAKIEIVQEAVAEGQEYHNPFSSSEDNVSVVEHNSYYNHVTQILEFGKIGEAIALGTIEQVTGIKIRDIISSDSYKAIATN